jgi:hypothetical protein
MFVWLLVRLPVAFELLSLPDGFVGENWAVAVTVPLCQSLTRMGEIVLPGPPPFMNAANVPLDNLVTPLESGAPTPRLFGTSVPFCNLMTPTPYAVCAVKTRPVEANINIM